MHKYLAAAHGQRDAMLASLETLVTAESPTADLDAIARSAAVIANLGTDVLDVAPDRSIIEGVTHLKWAFGTEPRVLILCHHDTVWPIGAFGATPFAYPAKHDAVNEVVPPTATGPGIFDMKTGIVQALYALAILRGAGQSLDGITLLITGDEETGSATSRELIEATARGCRAALVLEASADGGALKTARKGVSMYEVTVSGRAAHAGLEPEKGANASIELAHQILAIAALGTNSPGTTVTPTCATSGTTGNTVPAHATVHVDVRAFTVAAQEHIDTAMRSLRPHNPECTVTVSGGINRPPLEAGSSTELYGRAVAAAQSIGITPPAQVHVGGGSDGNFTAGIGIPTLDGLGAVGGGAHAPHEHILTAAVPERTALLAALVTDLLNADTLHTSSAETGGTA